jgi:Na+/H+ antiporter NhaC
MRKLADALQSIAATLWVGGLWVTGYVVAPVLFATLNDRALAGLVAGRLFSLLAWIGMACAAYLLIYRLVRYRAGALRQGLFWIVIVMLALTLAGEFGVQPVMAALKQQALPSPVMESALRDRFVLWHGVSSVIYLIESVLGAALIILPGREK